MQATWLSFAQRKLPGAFQSRRRRLYLAVGFPVVVLAALYIADLTFTSGKVPRGVTAAGVPLGGLTPDAADQRLQSVVAPRAAQPIAVTMATVQAEVDRAGSA